MIENAIEIGISSCLLGFKVRFDGQHKYDWYINEVLGSYFKYIPMCPELELGMGVPRKSVRLEGSIDNPQMIEPISGIDWTDRMHTYSENKLKQIKGLSGFIFKKGSPSCGLYRVKVYPKSGVPLGKGQGLFARSVCEKWPLLPVEDEGRLCDPRLRESFIERVFGYHRLQAMCDQKFNRGSWVLFHQRNKFLLLAHNRELYEEMGRLVAAIKEFSSKEFVNTYSELYMKTLAIQTTRKRNADVLIHIVGFLKKNTSGIERKSLLETIDAYRLGINPLIVPVTLLKHYVTVHNVEYVKDQTYLNPYPDELNLRNHV